MRIYRSITASLILFTVVGLLPEFATPTQAQTPAIIPRPYNRSVAYRWLNVALEATAREHAPDASAPSTPKSINTISFGV